MRILFTFLEHAVRLRQDIQPRELILRALCIRHYGDGAAAVFPAYAPFPDDGLGDGGTDARVGGDGVVGVEAVIRCDDGEESVDEAPGFVGGGDERKGGRVQR